jgi:hypothetical protein
MSTSASPRRRSWLRLFLMFLGVLALVLVAGIGAIVLALRHTRPAEGTSGPEADELAHALERSVDKDAWDRTGAVRWTFTAMKHQHLWDKNRQLARVRWDDLEVLVDINKKTGRAYRKGTEIQGAEVQGLVDKGYAFWANDSFWLNPVVKLFDPGVMRTVVTFDGGSRGLMVGYSSGGVTPGDQYMWIPGSDGRPAAWRMWVSVLPISGIEFRLGDWTRLSTGAQLATRHRTSLGLAIQLDDVAGAASLGELEPGPDPFAAIAPK